MLFKDESTEYDLLRLYEYSNLDFARFVIDRKFVSKYCFFLNEVVVFYASRKQISVVISTTEAEYVAMAAATREGV